MSFPIPPHPEFITVIAWFFAGAPIVVALIALRWIVKHVRFK